MPAFKDLTGQRFGRLIAVKYLGGSSWTCLCDCGTKTVVTGHPLRTGHTASCGCWKPDGTAIRSRKHGHNKVGKRTRTYRAWANMLTRCRNPKSGRWESYGGRGITVCERWLIFINFLADMGECPPGMYLDRIDVNGNYELGNCRWATASENSRNRRPQSWGHSWKNRHDTRP